MSLCIFRKGSNSQDSKDCIFSLSLPSTVLPQNPAYRMKQEKYDKALNKKEHLWPNLVICICLSVPEAISSGKAVGKKNLFQ